MTSLNHPKSRAGQIGGGLTLLGLAVQSADWLRNRAVVRDERGAILTEYAMLVGVVGVTSFATLLFAGAAVAKSYCFVRDYILYPFP